MKVWHAKLGRLGFMDSRCAGWTQTLKRILSLNSSQNTHQFGHETLQHVQHIRVQTQPTACTHSHVTCHNERIENVQKKYI